jgi:hypothetical protein
MNQWFLIKTKRSSDFLCVFRIYNLFHFGFSNKKNQSNKQAEIQKQRKAKNI